MAEQPTPSTIRTAESMAALLARQREAFLSELPVTAATRIDRIDRAIHLLADNEGSIADALPSTRQAGPMTDSISLRWSSSRASRSTSTFVSSVFRVVPA